MSEGCAKALCDRGIFGRAAVIPQLLALVLIHYLVVRRRFSEEGVTIFLKPEHVIVWANTSTCEDGDFEPIAPIMKVADLLEAGNLQGREGKEWGVDGILFLVPWAASLDSWEA